MQQYKQEKYKQEIERLLKRCPETYTLRYKKNSVELQDEERIRTLSYEGIVLFLKKRCSGKNLRSSYYG